MYNKTIIKFGFSDIQNKQGKGYQPQPLAFFFHIKLKLKRIETFCCWKNSYYQTLLAYKWTEKQ